jgi:hypothetical protein
MKTRLILIATALLVLAPAIFAAALTVDPAAQIKTLGQQAAVTIESSDGYIGDFDLDVSWDPSILSLFSINNGTQLCGPADYLQLPFVVGAATVNAAEVSLLSPADLIALQPGQTATILSVVFNTIGLGTSPVDISVTTLGDENGIDATPGLQLTGGTITVIERTGMIPEPSSAVLLASALAFLGWRLRRR